MKKRTNKILAIFLAVLLFAFAPLSGLGQIATLTAEAVAETANVALETDWELDGQFLTVDVYFTDAVGLDSWDLLMDYDDDMFSYYANVAGDGTKAVNSDDRRFVFNEINGEYSDWEYNLKIKMAGWNREPFLTAEEFMNKYGFVVNDEKFHFLTIYLKVEDVEAFKSAGTVITITGSFLVIDNDDYVRIYVEDSISNAHYCAHEDRSVTTIAATCIANGSKTSVCSVCGSTIVEEIPLDPENHVGETELRNAASATETKLGYTGDVYCLSCNTVVQAGEYIAPEGCIEYGTCGENLTWILNADYELLIYGTGAMEDFYVVPWSAYCEVIKSVVIEDGATSISRTAFSNCTAVQSVALPESLTSIDDYAFSGCAALTCVTIPSGVTSIGTGVFSTCVALNAVNAAETNEYFTSADGVLYNKDKTTLVCYPGAKTETVFSVPASVEKIADWAFFGNDKLNAIVLPDGLKEIGEFAFVYCNSLVEIVVPASIEELGLGSFELVPSLSDVYYMGTEEQWNAFKSNVTETTNGNDALFNADIHFNYTLHEKTETIPAVAPTCTEAGTTEGVKCAVCDTVIKEVQEIPATGHTWGEWEIITDADVEKEGLKKRICAVCSAEETAVIPGLERQEFKDETSGISVAIDKDAYGGKDVEVKAEEVFDGSHYMGVSYGKIETWNIKTYVDGEEAQPGAPVYVKIPLPAGFNEEKVFVYHINSQTGVREKMETEIIDGYICFYASSFSLYIVVDESTRAEAETEVFLTKPYTIAAGVEGELALVVVGTTAAGLLAASNATDVLNADGEKVAADGAIFAGMQLVILDGETVVDSVGLVVIGDINNDGEITSSDARSALRNSVGLDELSETQLKAADVNGDGEITSSDARSILRASVALDDPKDWIAKF